MGPYAWLANPYTFEEPMCTKDRGFIRTAAFEPGERSLPHMDSMTPQSKVSAGMSRRWAFNVSLPLVSASDDPADDRHWHRNRVSAHLRRQLLC
jgi:hypothetical protein